MCRWYRRMLESSLDLRSAIEPQTVTELLLEVPNISSCGTWGTCWRHYIPWSIFIRLVSVLTATRQTLRLITGIMEFITLSAKRFRRVLLKIASWSTGGETCTSPKRWRQRSSSWNTKPRSGLSQPGLQVSRRDSAETDIKVASLLAQREPEWPKSFPPIQHMMLSKIKSHIIVGGKWRFIGSFPVQLCSNCGFFAIWPSSSLLERRKPGNR